jgi:exosome complex RNA-binding protein Rrp42 (RNase PH superfamily)
VMRMDLRALAISENRIPKSEGDSNVEIGNEETLIRALF